MGNELVLGPFQGPWPVPALAGGKVFAGQAWKKEQVIIVNDVQQFPGHIACNEACRSEIVLPVKQGKEVLMVLDVDSEVPSDFDAVDSRYLAAITQLIFPVDI